MTSQIILLYLFKMTIVSGIFFGYYWFSLRDKKFHHYNRFYLLSASFLSIVIPFLQLNWFTIQQTKTSNTNYLLQYVTQSRQIVAQSPTIFTLLNLSVLILMIGAVILFVKIGYNLNKLNYIKQNGEVTSMDGFDFINTEVEEAPFSFLNNLFWKKSISLEETRGQQIFKHELTHIQEKHTWDRLYCQLVACLFWMNPFNWLIQKELETIHEFIADEAAVGLNNTAAFAQMLLETHYGHHFLNPTHTFFYSSIKRRLAMLSDVQHSKFSYLRKLMGVPVLLFVLILFAVKFNAEARVKSNIQKLDKVLLVTTSLDTIPKVDVSKSKIITSKKTSKNIFIQPKEARLAISDSAFVTLDMVNKIDPNRIKVLNILDTKQATEKYGTNAKYGAIELVIQPEIKQVVLMRRPVDRQIIYKVQPLYVLNGVAIESVQFDSLQPSDIKAIQIRKDEEVKQMFGEKGKNGVIFITTKGSNF